MGQRSRRSGAPVIIKPSPPRFIVGDLKPFVVGDQRGPPQQKYEIEDLSSVVVVIVLAHLTLLSLLLMQTYLRDISTGTVCRVVGLGC